MRVERLSGITSVVTRYVKSKRKTASPTKANEQPAGQSKDSAEHEAEPLVGMANQSPIPEPETWIDEITSAQTRAALKHIHLIQHEIADYGDEFAGDGEQNA